MARLAGLGVALWLMMGAAMGQAQAPMPPEPAALGYQGLVPYASEPSQADESVGVSWMPFDSLLLNVSAQPPGMADDSALSRLSGTWLGPQSIAVNAYAGSAQGSPAAWNAVGYCHSQPLLVPGCAPRWYGTGTDGLRAMEYGLRTLWQPLEGFSLGLGYHSRDVSGQATPWFLPDSLDFLAPAWNAGLSVPGAARAQGVELDMAYGFDAGFIGQLEFELRLSHELNRSLQLDGQRLLDTGNWRQDPLSHATFGFNWNRGDFSGSLSSRYVDRIFLNGQREPASWTSLDINFAWRTPWDGSLSVGAKNLLGNEPPMAKMSPDGPLPPGLNEAFSSIPYVRYEQDL